VRLCVCVGIGELPPLTENFIPLVISLPFSKPACFFAPSVWGWRKMVEKEEEEEEEERGGGGRRSRRKRRRRRIRGRYTYTFFFFLHAGRPPCLRLRTGAHAAERVAASGLSHS